MMSYSHTQRAPVWLIVILFAAAGITAAYLVRGQTALATILVVTGAAMAFVSLCFQTLTIADEGQWLSIRYGPLPLFRKRIPYTAISDVQPAQTALIDGWGIHYIPGRGWTWNLWGRDCVRAIVNGQTVQIGSNDAVNLANFVRSKIGG